MTISTYSTNMTDVYAGAGSTTGWSAIGGGPSGLNAETDYFIQGTGMTSKNAFASARRGMILNDGVDRAAAIGTDGAVLIWTTHSTPNSLDTIANGGITLLVGSGDADYKHWYVGGSDTIEFMGWILAAVNPSEATDEADAGTPTAIEDHFGILFDLPIGGPTKGAPNAIDAIRVGRCDLIYEFGTGADPEATFDLAVIDKGNVADRLGLIQARNGSFFMSGLHQLGSSANAVEFTDSAKTMFWNDHPAVTAPFNTIEILNASSIINMTNIAMKALGTKSPGTWVTTDNATVNLVGCSFIDMGAFGFDTNTTANSTWVNCLQIDINGANISGSTIQDANVAANESASLWNIAVSPVDGIDGVTFEMGATLTHAIEFGTTSPLTMTLNDCVFAGYNTTVNDQNNSTFHIRRTSGTVTINITGSGTSAANLTYRSDGATVIIQQNVNVTFDTMKNDTEVRVYDNSTGVEITGIENATAGTSDNRNFVATVGAGTVVDYVILSIGFEYIRVEAFTWPSTNQTINVAQRVDRNDIGTT